MARRVNDFMFSDKYFVLYRRLIRACLRLQSAYAACCGVAWGEWAASQRDEDQKPGYSDGNGIWHTDNVSV